MQKKSHKIAKFTEIHKILRSFLFVVPVSPTLQESNPAPFGDDNHGLIGLVQVILLLKEFPRGVNNSVHFDRFQIVNFELKLLSEFGTDGADGHRPFRKCKQSFSPNSPRF
jgi:hypothetical protein